MKKAPLKQQIAKAKEVLQADEKQMARYLGMNLDTYRAIERGGRNLPVVAQNSVMKRLERLLDKCGLKLT